MAVAGKANGGRPVFERVLGEFSATAVSLGAIIGSGIFFIIGFAAEEAGPAVVLSLVLAGAVAVLTSLSFASLGSKIPREGGEYEFVYIAFGPRIGLFAGLLWLLATAIGGVTVSLALASYLAALLNVGYVNVIAALACIVFMAADIAGLRFSSKVNNMLVIAKIGVLVLFVLLCAQFVRLSNFGNFLSKGTDGVLAATFLIFFAYAGFGKITAAAEEVKDPQRTIPKAIIAGILIATVLYIATAAAAVGAVGAGALASQAFRNAPLAHVMSALGFPWAMVVISIGAVAATASVLLLQMLGLSRTVYAMSRNRQLPPELCELHPEFRTPYKAGILLGLLMAAVALLVSVKAIIGLTSLGILAYYAIINLAALVMKRHKKGFDVHEVVPVLGFVSCALLGIYYLATVFGF